MVTEFNNARLDYQNFSFGPDAGRIYSLDHSSDSLIVKNDPAGVLDVPVALVGTVPLNTDISSEVRTLQYDGFYFWSQRDIGGTSPIGTLIEKWAFSATGATLIKQLGVGNEFSLVDTFSVKFDSEAMAIHTLERQVTVPFNAGATVVTISDSEFAQVGDEMYLGPNGSNEREVVEIAGILGTVITLAAPTVFGYSAGQGVIIRKNLWLFNNKNGTETFRGQLRQYSTYTGNLISSSTSNEWKDITAATSFNSNLYFVRDTQYLAYRPLGVNQGYQSSGILNNVESDNNTLVKVYDISINNSSISKLQLSLTEFNSTSKEFEDLTSTDNKYNIEREFFTPKVKSITAKREERSIMFGQGIEVPLTVEVRDQYNIPVFGRAITVSDDNATGTIKPGQESFITNTLGQGLTTYVTGPAPDFAMPLITAIDVVTDIRGNFITQQIREIDTLTFIEQFQTRTNRATLVQEVLNSELPLSQGVSFSTKVPLDQTLEQVSEKPLQQVNSVTELPIVQDLLATTAIPIDQFPEIEAITTLNQYIFLIFAVPEPFSKKNDPTTGILVRLVGFGVLALVPSTLSFKVNGIEVANLVNIVPFPGGLELQYDPSEDFLYGSRVTIGISIDDTGLPPNTISTDYYFDIIEDFRRPTVSQLFPPDQSAQNEPDTVVFAVIEDAETGIDESSIELYVEGRLVPHTLSYPSEGLVKVLYSPSCNFPYESEITASIVALDNSGNRLIETWTFYVQQSPGVLFIDTVPANCQVLVPVETELCSEVFGLEEGVHIGSLIFDINGQTVRYVLKPKVYRKE
ncbi:MAG: hypothetical protein DRH08_01315 [Deltaproteobacteria bacterium]|nr:MAG: hypothetical protein DRH08_01315 [Deltaproteobacteria bacterium]